MLKRFLMRRALLALLHDVAMAGVAFCLALYLRVGTDMFDDQLPGGLGEGLAVFLGCAAVGLLVARVPFTNWRLVSLPDVMTIAAGCAVAVVLFLFTMFLYTRLEGVPRSATVMTWFVMFVALTAPRIAVRLVQEGRLDRWMRAPIGGRVPILLVGGGAPADLFLRALRRHRDRPWEPVGIVENTAWTSGANVQGVPVLGLRRDLGTLLADLEAVGRKPEKLVLADPDLPNEDVAALLEAAGRHGLSLAKLPRLPELEAGFGADQLPSVRPVALEDLLGRPQQVLDRERMRRLVQGRHVLITGAGGTIGGELARQIAGFGPGRLTLLDASEFGLYAIDQAIAVAEPALARHAVLADVRRRGTIERVMQAMRPDLVFHSAALKHVPIVEAQPVEGVWTNAVGTRHVADACLAAGVGAMVLVSTDKAVNPANAMGASKRLAEQYCQGLDLETRRRGSGTRFVTVRFGNVLGSTGSVVPLFQQQLARGGPLTVTHPEVTRFFMTVREAVELMLQAAAYGVTGPERHGAIYVLDMGRPVRIDDLARQMIRLAGLVPDRDVAIVHVGLRPGEKLHEELIAPDEPMQPTDVPGVRAIRPHVIDPGLLARGLAEIERLCEAGDVAATQAALQRLVPGYRPAAPAGEAARPEQAGPG